MERQVRCPLEYFTSKGYRVIGVLTDIASGLRTDGRGLRKLLELVASNQVKVVAVAYRDRLFRSGLEYLERAMKAVVARTVVRSEKLPRNGFNILVELEGMYRNAVERLVMYVIRNDAVSFTKLKALRYREMRNLYPQPPSHYVYTACQDASARARSFLRLKKKGLTGREYPQGQERLNLAGQPPLENGRANSCYGNHPSGSGSRGYRAA